MGGGKGKGDRTLILFGIDSALDVRLREEARRLGITPQELLDRIIPAGLATFDDLCTGSAVSRGRGSNRSG